MMGAGEILLMNQLMSSNRSTYSDSSSVITKRKLNKKTKDMFLQLNEVTMSGAAKSIHVNFGYVERFNTVKFQPMDFKSGVYEKVGNEFDVTQLVFADDNTINVHEGATYIQQLLK